jgi:hypothetical protein
MIPTTALQEDATLDRTDSSRATLPMKVVYIAGAGRSGSTILNADLGMHEEIVAVGELRYLASLEDRNAGGACGTWPRRALSATGLRDVGRAGEADRGNL